MINMKIKTIFIVLIIVASAFTITNLTKSAHISNEVDNSSITNTQKMEMLDIQTNSISSPSITAFTTTVIANITSPVSLIGNTAVETFVATYNLTGDGSVGNPYIIENFFFNGTNAFLQIAGTSYSIIIRNNIFDMINKVNAPIHIHEFAGITPSNILITNNTILNSLYGILINGVIGNTVQNITISKNKINVTAFEGISINYAVNVLIENNAVSNTKNGILITAGTSANVTIQHNVVSFFSTYGISFNYLTTAQRGVIYNNTIINYNTITNNQNLSGTGIYGNQALLKIVDNTISGTNTGINIYISTNLTIDSNEVVAIEGMRIRSVSNVVITNNYIETETDKTYTYTIDFSSNSNVTFRDNVLFGRGLRLDYFSNNIQDLMFLEFQNITLNGKLIVYLLNQDGVLFDGFENYAQIIIINSSNIVIRGLEFVNVVFGLLIYQSQEVDISDTLFNVIEFGVISYNSTNIDLMANSFINLLEEAILVTSSSQLNIMNNIFTDIEYVSAINSQNTDNITIESNYFENVYSAIEINSATSVYVIKNTILQTSYDAGNFVQIIDLLISENIITNIGDNGLSIGISKNIVIDSNYISNTFGNLININQNTNTSVMKNYLGSSNTYSIRVYQGNYTIQNNIFEGNSQADTFYYLDLFTNIGNERVLVENNDFLATTQFYLDMKVSGYPLNFSGNYYSNISVSNLNDDAVATTQQNTFDRLGITSTGNINYDFQSTGNIMTYTISNPSRYELYIDKLKVETGFAFEKISVNIDGLDSGPHLITFVLINNNLVFTQSDIINVIAPDQITTITEVSTIDRSTTITQLSTTTDVSTVTSMITPSETISTESSKTEDTPGFTLVMIGVLIVSVSLVFRLRRKKKN